MYEKFINNTRLRRFTVLALVIFILFLVKDFLTPILLTFIFTLISVRVVKFVQRFIKAPTFLLATILYVIELVLLYLLISRYSTILIDQVVSTYDSIVHFYQHKEFQSDVITNFIADYFKNHNWQDKLESGAGMILVQLQNVGRLAVEFVMSFILSFFFMIEKEKTVLFSRNFLSSEYAWFFQDLFYFAKVFVETFGVVVEVQLLIALVNTLVTTLGLGVIGFTQLPTLAIMIFFLSLIPVAGVIFSCIPLTLIAYSTGGIQTVVYVLILIVIVHCIEAYILNPKFMSSRTKLPIFYTFVILLFSERFLGVWGLIVGIPIFNFFLEILGVKIRTKKTEQLD
ncbi:AI-2E family transporter [Enterococcus devriesei]|uniref:AI-2E family transporter n=1 Tax=Enterococcus TaxID=1350 RepID=UPI0009002CA2|nr:AI-2E family transporter [Enterococcus devriesei]MBU5364732.1 AI-2E family transporter [Enterococcus devriesei]MDU6524267.1 AI-2E family transporter [Enterococcus sp.]